MALVWNYVFLRLVHTFVFQGHQINFVKVDESSRKWLNEFRTKPFSVPGKLENVDGNENSNSLYRLYYTFCEQGVFTLPLLSLL